MHDPLSRLLAERTWLLADGATGTNLFQMGLEAGEAPELWNADEPDKVRALYRGAVDAGSDVFLTNSFGSQRARLKLHDAAHRAGELSRLAAALAREIADAAGRRVVVAGSMGPTGEILEPVGTFSQANAVEVFHEQAEGLKEGGADVLWIETISSVEEFTAAARAAALAGMAWCGMMSFDTAGRTMMGVTSRQFARLVQQFDPQPVAFGANCGVGASDLLRTVVGFHAGDENGESGANGALPIIAKGNAGIPKYRDGHVYYDGTPEKMAQYAVLARDCGARIIGGCCGTMPAHLRAMRAALEEHVPGEVPGFDRIEATLGGLSSPSDGTEPGAGAAAGTGKPARRTRRRTSAGATGNPTRPS